MALLAGLLVVPVGGLFPPTPADFAGSAPAGDGASPASDTGAASAPAVAEPAPASNLATGAVQNADAPANGGGNGRTTFSVPVASGVTVPQGVALPSEPRGTDAVSGGSRASAGEPLSRSGIRPSTLPGSAAFTLEVGNGTVLAGNVVPGTPREPEFAAYDPLTGLVYVSDGGPTVYAMTPSDFGLVGSLRLPYSIGNLVFDPLRGLLLGESTQAVVGFYPSNGTIAFAVPVPDAASGLDGTLVLDPVDYRLWVTNPFSSNVSIVDLESVTVVAHRYVGIGFNDILAGIYDPVNGRIYLSYYENQTVEVFDAHTLARLPSVSLGAFCCFAWGLGLDPETGVVYATVGLVGYFATVVAIAPGNDSVVGSVGVGGFPSDSVYDAGTGELYVADAYKDRLTVVDPANLTVVGRLPLAEDAPLLAGQVYPLEVGPLHAVVVPMGYGETVDSYVVTNTSEAFVVNSLAQPTVSVLDPACGCVAIGDAGRDALYLVTPSTLTVLATVALPGQPRSIAYDPASGALWVVLGGLFYTDGVDILNGSTGAPVKLLGDNNLPWGVAYDPLSDRMFVSDYFGNDVRVYNASNMTLLRSVPTGNQSSGIVYDPALHAVVVANWGTGNLSVLNGTTGSELPPIAVGGAPEALGIDPTGRVMLVGDASGAPTRWLNASNLSAPGSLLPIPYGHAFTFDPAASTAYEFNYSGQVFAISLANATITTLAAGEDTVGGTWVAGVGLLAVDPLAGAVYLLPSAPVAPLTGPVLRASPLVDSLGGNVTLQVQFGGGVAPFTYRFLGLPRGCTSVDAAAVACQPLATGAFLVTAEISDADGSVAAASSWIWVGPTYRVTVDETGLPTGATWAFALLGGPSVRSNGTSAAVLAENGSWWFSAGTLLPHYLGFPTSGRLTVAGAAIVVRLTFVPTFEVTFTESGLPSPLRWSVSLNGSIANSTSGGSVSFWVPNGSFPYASGAAGYATSPGTAVVSGAAVTIPLVFVVATQGLVFEASGLVPGVLWGITLGNVFGQQTTTSGSITFREANGTYTWTVLGASGYTYTPSGGSVTLDGATQVIPIAFSKLYTLTFTEANLPAGTTWAVNIGYESNGGSTTSVSFSVPAGTYTYQVEPVPGFSADPPFGNVTLGAGTPAVPIVFVPGSGRYPLTFQETGLPRSVWNITVDGVTSSSTNGSVELEVPNGTYSYRTAATVYVHNYWYYSLRASGAVTVLGFGASVVIPFLTANTANLTFYAIGLTAGLAWGVTLAASNGAGVSAFTNASTLTLPVPVVQVGLRVSAPAGFGFVRAVWPGVLNSSLLGYTGFGWARLFFATLENVTFDETGLTGGAYWGVVVRSASSHGGAPAFDGTSSGTALTLSVPTGAWTFKVNERPSTVRPVPLRGSLRVPNHALLRTIVFRPVTERVLFRELGLPVGTPWGVNVTGPENVSLVTRGAALTFHLTNGTYSFIIWNEQFSSPNPSTGRFAATAGPNTVVVHVQFLPFP